MKQLAGLARTGASMTNGSGGYVVAFSTAQSVRRRSDADLHEVRELADDATSPLFRPVAEATEEAIYNSLLQAKDLSGHGGSVRALPVDVVRSLPNSQTQQ
jgi:D-aminopeptidase